MQSKITSVTQINKNIEEGRLLYAAMSLLAKKKWFRKKPDQVLQQVLTEADILFPEVKEMRDISGVDEWIRRSASLEIHMAHSSINRSGNLMSDSNNKNDTNENDEL